MSSLRWGVGSACALLVACGSQGSPAPGSQGPARASPTLSKGGFTYYASAQGMAPDPRDVAADEAGNVYVAAGDAVLAKKRGDAAFQRFDAAAIGVTRNCDEARTRACPVASVGGGAPGVVVLGLRGLGTDGDSDPDWWLDSGGADVFAFDGAALSKRRHVQVSGVPHQMCMDHSPGPCSTGDATWEKGRRKVRQVLRIAIDHRVGDVHYGDVWMAGTHGSFNLLVAKPEQRGWKDLTAQFPGTEDRRSVWEHDHPAMTVWATIGGVKQLAYTTGTTTALALDPRTGDPWAANETRLATKLGAGAAADGWNADMWPPWRPDEVSSHLDVWPDPHPANPQDYDATDPRWMDAVSSLSFCDDGTLWIASSLHGLARRAPDGSISYLSLPAGTGDDASAVACDPSDGSVWVGFGWGGFGRWNGARWWTVAEESPPAYAVQAPTASIQIDRWASPRVVYVAQQASRLGPGGLTVYSGP
ncbi:MAG TPA: hypothetical protein VF875_09095 [Anaeromyxobacter sp.]